MVHVYVIAYIAHSLYFDTYGFFYDFDI